MPLATIRRFKFSLNPFSGLIGGLIAALFIKASLVAMAGFVLVGATLLLVSLTPINRSAKTMS